MAGHRLLSYSEIETAMTCMARWDFRYGGRLAGDTLKAKTIAPILSEGRAWGAAVATWHANSTSLFGEYQAYQALAASLRADAAWMVEHGGLVPSFEDQLDVNLRLSKILEHYMATATPLPNLTRLEGQIVVPVPSRSRTGRGSTRYRFLCRVDGYTTIDGQRFLVEFKLRHGLTPAPIIERQRQPRWYAWALGRMQGWHPDGVIIEERLNAHPEPARLVQGRGRASADRVPSHAKNQMTTPELYVDLCLEHGVDPHQDVVDSLHARLWQQRHPIPFRPGELKEAGMELRDAGKLIRDLDSGEMYPIRNASRMHCNGCAFRDVCSNPDDGLFIDTLFERTVPKRLRDPEEETQSWSS